MRAPPRPAAGFTLIELIMVIAISGIMAATMGQLIGGQMAGYQSLSERAALVQLAQTAIRRIERDVHRGLPNSVRISASSVEVLNVLDGGRYRASHTIDTILLDPTVFVPAVTPDPGTLYIQSAVNALGAPIDITTYVNINTAGNVNQLKTDDKLYLPILGSAIDPYWLATVTGSNTVRLRRYDGSASNGTNTTLTNQIVTRLLGKPLVTNDVSTAAPTALGVKPLLCESAARVNQFDLIGGFSALQAAVGTCTTPTNLWLVTHNLTADSSSSNALQNAYHGPNVDSDVANVTQYCQPTTGNFQATVSNWRLSNTTAGTPRCPFPTGSASQRIYLVDTPVSYVCAGGLLTRYTGYLARYTNTDSSLAPAAVPLAAPAGASGTVLVNQLNACNFSLSLGNGNIPSLLTVTLTLRSAAGESVSIAQQITIENEI